jgi:hypothetical protein
VLEFIEFSIPSVAADHALNINKKSEFSPSRKNFKKIYERTRNVYENIRNMDIQSDEETDISRS